MKLSELVRPEDIVLPFAPNDKWDAIAQLSEHAVTVGRLSAEQLTAARDALFARERSMSTGMEHGIAIPHAAIDDLAEVAAVMGIVQGPNGLPFESIDGSSARIIILLVIPRREKLVHIRTLADIARGLARENVRCALIESESPAAAWDVMN
ncbi:MAG: PTS sugar transporter subunit IIA [Planctomycetota bacterium]